MTKTIKLSLAAIIAAGFTTSAFAEGNGPKLSGSVAFKYEKKDSTQDDFNTKNKVTLTASGDVSDTISYKVTVDENTQSDVTNRNGGGVANEDGGMNISHANFTYKNAGATVVAGRQGIATPYTTANDIIDGTQEGNGISATYSVSPEVTLGAVVMDGHNINVDDIVANDSNLVALAVLAKAGDVNLQGWYATVAESDVTATALGLSSFTLAADTTIQDVKVALRHANLSPDSKIVKDQSMTSLSVKAKLGNFGVNAGFAKTGKDGDRVSLDRLGNNAANDQYLGAWNVSVGGGNSNDATMYSLGVSAKLSSMISAHLNYASLNGDLGSTKDETKSEIKAQLSFNVAKGLSLYLRGADVSYDKATASDFTRTRLFAGYRF